MHQGYIKVVTNFVQSYQISFSNITDLIQVTNNTITSRGILSLKARTTDMFIEPFPSFVPNTHKLYMLGHCINIVFTHRGQQQSSYEILQKNHISPCAVKFELSDKLIQLSFDCSYFRSTEGELINSYFSKAQQIKPVKGYQKSDKIRY